ncbi:protein transporter tim9 [Pleurotus pulmonarius]|nr:protein transporter tim9 [Pleurotus pulmonarius]
MDFSSFNAAEQAQMTKIIEKKQVRVPFTAKRTLSQGTQMQDFLRMYSNLVEKCFNSCCNDFTSKALSSKEEQCVMNCTEKFIKHSERVGSRFAELNAGASLPQLTEAHTLKKPTSVVV